MTEKPGTQPQPLNSALPTLVIVPLPSLILHEQHDDKRSQPVVDSLKQSQVLRNPPVVAPLHDGSGRYVVLDGANRVTALKLLDFPHTIAQLVEASDENIRLKTWNHVVLKQSPEAFLQAIRSLSEVTLNPGEAQASYQEMMDNQALAVIHLTDQRVFALKTSPNTFDNRLQALNDLVSTYLGKIPMDRTQARQPELLHDLFPDLSALIIFPHFEVHQILDLTAGGKRLPSGITRFMVSPRALRVNYPLAGLQSPLGVEQKNMELQVWLQERLRHKTVRYYAEHTVLYDE